MSKGPSACTQTLSLSAYSAYLCGIQQGDRRGSNPRPPEPHSADMCFQVLPHVAESASISLFLCSRLPAVSGCCVLSGVSSGVKRYRLLSCSALSHRVFRQAWRPCSQSGPCHRDYPCTTTRVKPSTRPRHDYSMKDAANGLQQTHLPRCEYPGEWLRAKPRGGLTLLPRGPNKGALQVTRRPDSLASPAGRPGPEQSVVTS